jgi:hypothetical protein
MKGSVTSTVERAGIVLLLSVIGQRLPGDLAPRDAAAVRERPINSVLTEAFSCRISRTGSMPSSLKDTAPIWIPIVFLVANDCVCSSATVAAAKLPADWRRKSRRVASDKCSHLVVCHPWNDEFHDLSVP